MLGDYWYLRRADNSNGIYADPGAITNAISFYSKAYNENPSEDIVSSLLKSLYFKGSFVKGDQLERKAIFDKGRCIGEKMIEIYPNSVSINFWLAAMWGKWAKNFGPIQAVYEGAWAPR